MMCRLDVMTQLAVMRKQLNSKYKQCKTISLYILFVLFRLKHVYLSFLQKNVCNEFREKQTMCKPTSFVKINHAFLGLELVFY